MRSVRTIVIGTASTVVVSFGCALYGFSVFATDNAAGAVFSTTTLSIAFAGAVIASGLSAAPLGRWMDAEAIADQDRLAAHRSWQQRQLLAEVLIGQVADGNPLGSLGDPLASQLATWLADPDRPALRGNGSNNRIEKGHRIPPVDNIRESRIIVAQRRFDIRLRALNQMRLKRGDETCFSAR